MLARYVLRRPAAAPILSYAEYRNNTYFDQLDGLRACSILLVFLQHVDGRNPPQDQLFSWLLGFLGVSVFFVLSGFLITTLALREEESKGALSVGNFYLRRTFRIFPLYFFVLLLYTVAALANYNAAKSREFLATLPYLVTYTREFSHASVFAHAWSLGVEEKFYLVWPVLAFVALRRFARLRLWTTLVLVAAPLVVGLLTGLFKDQSSILWLTGYAMIMLGCAVAECLHDPGLYQYASRLGTGRGMWFCAALVLAAHWFVGIHSDHDSPGFAIAIFLFAAASSAFLIPTLIAAAPWNALLTSRPMIFIGRRSYAIYLIHNWISSQVEARAAFIGNLALRRSICFAGSIFIAIVVADLLHRLIEKPCIEFGRRVINGRQREARVDQTVMLPARVE